MKSENVLQGIIFSVFLFLFVFFSLLTRIRLFFCPDQLYYWQRLALCEGSSADLFPVYVLTVQRAFSCLQL